MLEGLVERNANNPKRLAYYESELAQPPLPPALAYLWKAFCRLSARRGSNGFSVAPITWPDIDAFVRQSRIELAPFEIRLIEDLDDLYRAEAAKPRD